MKRIYTLISMFAFTVGLHAATAGFPGALNSETTGYLNIGAVQQLRPSTAGFPGVLNSETTGYLSIGSVQRDTVFSAGTLTEDSDTTNTITVSWTASSGGLAPITEQLQMTTGGGGTWTNVAGATSSPVEVTGLSPSVSYDFRVAFTDDSPATVYSATNTFATESTGTITITSPVSFQIVQMNVSGRATITITGTYTGNPSSLEARWAGGPWQTIVGTPAGGTFSGMLGNRAKGQGALQVRFGSETGLVTTANYVGVGHLFACLGQSNMSGRGLNNQTYSHGSLKATLLGNDYVWKELADPYDSNASQTDAVSSDASTGGSFIPLLATALMDFYGAPVGFIPAAKGGSAITSWLPDTDHQDRATLYGSAVYRALQAGGVKMALWWQGEQDALAAMSQATYNGHLDTVANAVATDLGVKLMPCLLQDITDVSIEPGVAAIQAAIEEAWGNNANVAEGPDLSAIACGADGVHVTGNTELASAATLWAAAIEGAAPLDSRLRYSMFFAQ